MVEDSDAAREVPFRIQDGLVWVMRSQAFGGSPIEGATVSLAVFVAELQQPLLVNNSARDVIGYCDLRLSMANIGRSVEAGLRGGHSLEEIGPPRTLVGFAHGVKGGAI